MERFVDVALRGSDSLFTPGTPIWTRANIEELYERFAGNPDESSDSFEEKFYRQLDGASPQIYQLAGEMLYIHLLVVSNDAMHAATRRNLINLVLQWSPAPVSIPADLDETLEIGLSHPGMAYLIHRPYQLWFILDFMRAWKQLPPTEQTRLLDDPWAFREFVHTIPVDRAYSQREMLLYIVHPDTFERIFSREHKKTLMRAFRSLVSDTTANVDQQIAEIRQHLAQDYGADLDFYDPELKPRWQPPKESASEDDVSEEDEEGDDAALDSDTPAANTQDGNDTSTTWIFQANPQYYDLTGSLEVLPEQTWQINQYRHQIKAGHTVYFWESGQQAGVLARGRVLTDPADMPQDEAEQAFVRSDGRFEGAQLRVRVYIDEVLPRRITRDELAADAVLQELPILKVAQGTNFPVRNAQVAALDAAFDRAMAATGDERTATSGVTGAEAGLSGDDQIVIALREIEQRGGTATMQQIYNAISKHIGQPLSEQGRASLRFFVNKVAVERGYVYPYDPEDPGWRITPEGRARLGLTAEEDDLDEAALDEAAFDDDIQPINTLEEWQADIQADEWVAWLVTEYPQWLAETFGERIEFRPLENQRFSVLSKGNLIQRGRFHDTDGLHIWFPYLPADWADKIRSGLSKSSTFQPKRHKKKQGYRFIVYTENDYRLLQEITADMIRQPMTMADAAHTILQNAGGGPLHLSDILKQAQEQELIETSGQTPQLSLDSVLLRDGRFNNLSKNMWVLAAPSDEDDILDEAALEEAAFDDDIQPINTLEEWQADIQADERIAWLVTEYPQWLAETFGERVEFRPLENQRFSVLNNGKRVQHGRFNQASGIYIWLQQPAESIVTRLREQLSKPQTVKHRARQQIPGYRFTVCTDDDYRLLQEITRRMVERSTSPDVSFWRIYFDPAHWDEAYSRGAIGLAAASDSGVSVQNLKQVQVGDRVIAWTRGGQVRGVGVVTHPFTDIRETPDAPFAADLFGGEYPLIIGVRWSEELTEPAKLAPQLRAQAPATYTRVVEQKRAVLSISRDDYITLLSLLDIDDISDTSIHSPSLLDLRAYLAVARQSGDQPLSAAALLEHARATRDDLDPRTDADTFATLLRQLRLFFSDGAGGYHVQPYTTGDGTALLRLMALAYLHPTSSDAEIYDLPARTIVPRLRDPAAAGGAFAPEFGAYAPHLLAWYAEAGLVSVDGDDWQPLPDALTRLEGDDEATQEYNRFLGALLAELDGEPTDVPPVSLGDPLPLVSDLEERLRELDTELIIDPQIVQRICRSLLAGRHVVLSGPPGTGKTELARRLPTLLWREPEQTFTRLTTRLDAPPVADEPEQRHGYAVELVTATEDWGVRDVVGGIGPRLNGTGGGLSYTIEHGHLTRTVLRHFAGTRSGRELPSTPKPRRQDYRDADKQRYRGIWLVIDEFTRAPIDAAFGSLLTTLSGGEQATLAVPTGGIERPVPLPRDFRIIGTLNSFDRHFLNQMSEALKRRFDFIDVLPPHPDYEAYEQGIAVKQALRRLGETGLVSIRSDGTPERYEWEGVVRAQPSEVDGRIRYTWHSDDPEARAALASFWRIFRAIRVFRQLGTAQAVAVYGNLFTGRVLDMSWAEALDTALADALADQLQVLSRDEQRTLDAYIEHAGNATAFTGAIAAILKEIPAGRGATFLYALREADQQRNGSSSIALESSGAPDAAQLGQVFELKERLQLPAASAFRSRLRDLIGERGL
jgi:hypothetical protein